MTTGERIRKRRLELNMTQDELAEKIGYASGAAIAKFESGRCLDMEKAECFAKALDVTPQWLIGWDEHETTEQQFTTEELTLLSECIKSTMDGLQKMAIGKQFLYGADKRLNSLKKLNDKVLAGYMKSKACTVIPIRDDKEKMKDIA